MGFRSTIESVCVCVIPCLSVASNMLSLSAFGYQLLVHSILTGFENRRDLSDSLLTGAIFLRVSFLLATPHSVKSSVANLYLISDFAHLLVF